MIVYERRSLELNEYILMNIKAVKTRKITSEDTDIFKILDESIPDLKENSVVAVTSKIISITEGSIIKINGPQDEVKEKLIRENSQYFLERASSKYNISFTIANNILSASAGIDESNGNGFYILWPKNPQESANKIREYLCERFGLKNLGVIITDSKTTPLRWGVTGITLSHSGFKALKDYIGKPDLFGRPFVYEKLNIADSLAAAAVLEMGEGDEQTPIAIMENLNNIEFQDRNPDDQELEELKISLDEDLYAPLIKNADWQKGEK